MRLTLNTLFNDASIISAVIDRVQALKLDRIYWQRYLTFEQTLSRTFKTYLGTVTGVTAGSVIDRNSNKPLRNKKSLGSGIGEVAYLGDRYQLDNDRLDMLQSLIDKFNNAQMGAGRSAAVNEIVNYIVDDMRQVMLAPHKRMDLVVGSLRSTGQASVKVDNNPDGIELIDIELPVKGITPAKADKANFITFLQTQLNALRTLGAFSVMEMTRATFAKAILGADEFKNTYKMVLGNAEFATAGGLITDTMATQLFTGIGLPAIRIVDEYVDTEDGGSVSTFKDNRITLLTSDNLGVMKWHTPYEAADPIPGKTYTRSDGGMFISSQRTDEGRFLEYGAEWIPDIKAPNKLVILNLDTMLA